MIEFKLTDNGAIGRIYWVRRRRVAHSVGRYSGHLLIRHSAVTMRPRKQALLITAGVVLMVVVGAALKYGRSSPPIRMRLPDGTRALYRSGSTIEPASQFPRPRRIIVDGDAFLIVPAAAEPLIVSSRLLLLTVSGRSALRITAFARQTGEQVQVLCGEVVARKHYPSNYDEPDHLGGGQMTMVNQSIDLMEKETFSPLEIKAWAAGIGADPLDLSCR